MTYIDTEYWNAISKMSNVKYYIFYRIFSLNDDVFIKFIDRAYELLIENGYSHKAASSFIDVSPLLFENKAISKSLHNFEHKYFELRNTLPEILSVNEAMILMTQEKMLNDLQKDELFKMLQDDWYSFIIDIYEEAYLDIQQIPAEIQ